MEGIEKLWFVGDDFMDETYRPYFKKARVEFHCKQRFEISKFCNSKRSSNNRFVTSRILNTFISAINAKSVLPRFVVFVIDKEIMEFVEYGGFGVSTLYGTILESLIKKVHATVEKVKSKLPAKAIKQDQPHIYWTPAITHQGFQDMELRNKYNLCLHSIVKLYPNMRVIKLKNYWDFNDNNLILPNGQISAMGKGSIWKSIDDALKFNIEKKEEFAARQLITEIKLKYDMANQRRLAEKRQEDQEEDPVQVFFHRQKQREHHWNNTATGNRFLLPRIDRRR